MPWLTVAHNLVVPHIKFSGTISQSSWRFFWHDISPYLFWQAAEEDEDEKEDPKADPLVEAPLQAPRQLARILDTKNPTIGSRSSFVYSAGTRSSAARRSTLIGNADHDENQGVAAC